MTIFSKIKGFFQDNEKYTLYNSVDRINFNNKNQTELLKYNDISLYVNKAINKRAEKVSEIQFVLKNSKGEAIEKHPVLDLLSKPNEFHTGKQFWKLFQKYLDITGNVFIYLKKKGELFDLDTIEAMYLLRPDLVKVNRDKATGAVTSYEYKNGSTTVSYTPQEVLHCIEPDPNNPIEGVSLLKAGIRAVETEIQLAEYQANILANGGKVEGIFRFKTGLTKTQISEMKESYAEDLAGAKKAGRPLFLGGDAEYQNLALNPTELSYLQSKGVTLNDICILTSVPKEVLGAVGETTYANADASVRIFLRETIKPLLVGLSDFLDWRLVAEDLTLSFIDPTPEDIDNKTKVVTALYSTDCSTINERRAIMGLDKYDDENADKILVSFSKTPLGEDVFAPQTVTDPATKKKAMTKSPACRVSDETKAECVARKIPELIAEGMPQDQAVAVANSVCSVSCEDKSFNHPLRDKAFREIYRKAQAKRFDKKEAMLYSAIKEYFAGQEARLKSRLTGIKQFKKKGLVDEIFDMQFEIKVAKDQTLPLLRKLMIQAGLETTDLLDYEFGFTMTSAMEKWLDNRVDLFTQEITQTTYKKLTNEFAESFDKGENRQELVSRIKNVYDGFDDTRARTIARTEVHGSVQKASFEAGKQAGSPIKIWVSVIDDVTRDSHAYLDGMEVPINQPFPNGLMFAGDPNAEADETINCRCSTA